ncbi:MAG: hypothetical protein ACK5LZ_06135 [Anaerorhabdus sp.]
MREETVRNARVLIEDLNKKKFSWNERDLIDFGGSKLTRAEVDLVSMYAEALINYNGDYRYVLTQLVLPLPHINSVFKQYGLEGFVK